MKAILLRQPGGPEQLYLGECPRPEPGERQILVKVAATALNRADTLQRRGQYPAPPGESQILGLEMAGVVEATGAGVSRWQPGDRVCGLLGGGGYAEYALIHEEMALRIPDSLSFEEAAAIPEVFLTAFQALRWLARLEEDEWVLIHAGASGVGTAAIQMAREMGGRVIVTASSAKHDLCRSLGASFTIDYKAVNFHESVSEITQGRGVDVILDFIGAPYFSDNLGALATDGRLIILALMGGAQIPALNIAPILRKRLQITGSTLRNRSIDYKIALTRDLAEFAWPRFRRGALRPVIDRVFDWKEVEEAHRYMEENRNQGKIVLRIA